MSAVGPVAPESQGLTVKVRNIAIGGTFALVLLVPKLLRLRRNKRSWMAFRILLAAAGAALVILPISFLNAWLPGIIGLIMFLAAVLLPPARPYTSIGDKARELGALVVVNGGELQHDSAPPVAVRLFVGVDQIRALDRHFQPVLTIPAAEISSVAVGRTERRWILRIGCLDHTAEFSYQGVFAEHLARAAESALRSVMRSPLPVLSQRRAAGA